MKVSALSVEQIARYGVTHRFEITYADLVALGAVTNGTISLADYVAGQGVLAGFYKLITAFTGGATSALAMIGGWDGTTTDDDDGIFAASYEVHATATEIFYGDANGAAFATLRTGYFPLDTGTYKMKFTATGGNLNALTAGEVHVFLRLANSNKV